MDDKFWNAIMPQIDNCLLESGYGHLREVIRRDVMNKDHELYFHVDGIKLPSMPKEFRANLRQWKTKKTKDNKNWGVIPLTGTTFSGHPVRTTLGNTFRSL